MIYSPGQSNEKKNGVEINVPAQSEWQTLAATVAGLIFLGFFKEKRYCWVTTTNKRMRNQFYSVHLLL